MKEEEFTILVKKYSENKCTAEEKKIVESFFNSLQHISDSEVIPPSDEKGKLLLNKIQQKINKHKISKRRFTQNALRIAAIFLIFVGLSAMIRFLVAPDAEITQIAARGERKEVVLQDGSIVVLNSNSSITYPETFGNTRKIRLTGEAYFKVQRDTTKPFLVSTHNVNVKVLGTSFNINSYSHSNTKVSVLTGKVEVSSLSGQKIVLTKNQQAALNSGSSGFTFSSNNSDEGIEWTKNIILLKGTSLGETAKIIENWYDVKVDFEDSSIKDLTISGKFKDEKFENVLLSIAVLKNLEIKYITKKHVL